MDAAVAATELNGASRKICGSPMPITDCPYERMIPPGGIPAGTIDVTRGSVPVLLVISIVVAIGAGAFHIGSLYSDINRERSEITRRLDNIEIALGKLLPAYASNDRKVKAH